MHDDLKDMTFVDLTMSMIVVSLRMEKLVVSGLMLLKEIATLSKVELKTMVSNGAVDLCLAAMHENKARGAC